MKKIGILVLFTPEQIKEIDRIVKTGLYGNARTDIVYQATLRMFS